jgi:hypothetical protein
MGLKHGPFSLVRVNEELIEWKNGGSCLENPDSWLLKNRCADNARDIY